MLTKRLDIAAVKHEPAKSPAEAMWIVDCEFNELAAEWHGTDWTRCTRDELLDLIVVSLRLLIDHMNFEELLDE